MRCVVTNIWTENKFKDLPIYSGALNLAKKNKLRSAFTYSLREFISRLQKEYFQFVKDKKFADEQALVDAFNEFLVEKGKKHKEKY